MSHSGEDVNDQDKGAEKETQSEIDSTVRVGKNLGKVIGVNIENFSLGVKIPGPVKRAILVLLIVVLVGASGYGIWYWMDQRARAAEAESKVIVAVADFYGADPDVYQITDNLIRKLRSGVSKYADTYIYPLGEVVRERDQGPERARELGERAHADLVLWGSYQVAGDVLLTLNIENLIETEAVTLDESATLEQRLEYADFQRSEYRVGWSTQISCFVEIILGVIRSEADDQENAAQDLTEVLESECNQDGMPGLDLAYFYRGSAYSYLGEYSDAIADYSDALALEPGFTAAQFKRAFAYREIGEYAKARDDFLEIMVDPAELDLDNLESNEPSFIWPLKTPIFIAP